MKSRWGGGGGVKLVLLVGGGLSVWKAEWTLEHMSEVQTVRLSMDLFKKYSPVQ